MKKIFDKLKKKVGNMNNSVSISGGSITVNGVTYNNVSGNNISVNNGKIMVDGVEITSGLQGDVKIIWDGPLANLNCTSSEIHGDVKKGVDGTNITVSGSVGGDIDGTNVTVKGNCAGDIDGTNVTVKSNNK